MSKRTITNAEILADLLRLAGLDADTPVRYIKIECEIGNAPQCTVDFVAFREEPEQGEAQPQAKNQYKTLDDPPGRRKGTL